MSLMGLSINGHKPNSYPVAERYTADTRNAIEFSRQQAQARGSQTITVTDLLAGLGWQENTRAERVGSLKTNAFYLRWLTGAPPLPARDTSSQDGGSEMQQFDADVKKALAFAVSEADRDREYWIDSDHLLRGLLCFPNNADFALLKTELSLNSARAASRHDREEFLPEENPSMKVIEYLIRKYLALWGPPILSLACYLYILIQTIGIELTPSAK